MNNQNQQQPLDAAGMRKLAEGALELARINAKPFYESNYGEKSTTRSYMVASVPDLAKALLAALDENERLKAVEQAAKAFVAANKAQHENGAWVIGEKSRLTNELSRAGVDALEIYWKVDRVSLDDKLIEAVKKTLGELERAVGE